MTGLNTNGNKFVAKKFHESVPLPLSSENLKLAAEEPLRRIDLQLDPYSHIRQPYLRTACRSY